MAIPINCFEQIILAEIGGVKVTITVRHSKPVPLNELPTIEIKTMPPNLVVKQVEDPDHEWAKSEFYRQQKEDQPAPRKEC